MKQQLKFTGLYSDGAEGLHVIDSPTWKCAIDDKSIPLSLIMEVIDMAGATGEPEYKQYPFLVSVGIIVSKPHKSFYDGTGKPHRFDLLANCTGYMGTIPIDHKLLHMDTLNKKLMLKLKAKDAKLVESISNFGTHAAQEGVGSVLTYPQFKTAEAAYVFGKALIEAYADTLMVLVGVTLDQPINMAGNNGWSCIEQMVNGCGK